VSFRRAVSVRAVPLFAAAAAREADADGCFEFDLGVHEVVQARRTDERLGSGAKQERGQQGCIPRLATADHAQRRLLEEFSGGDSGAATGVDGGAAAAGDGGGLPGGESVAAVAKGADVGGPAGVGCSCAPELDVRGLGLDALKAELVRRGAATTGGDAKCRDRLVSLLPPCCGDRGCACAVTEIECHGDLCGCANPVRHGCANPAGRYEFDERARAAAVGVVLRRVRNGRRSNKPVWIEQEAV
jgi:hypothetical protein